MTKLTRIAARIAAWPPRWDDPANPVDPDPDFRKVLIWLHDEMGATTYSSCQGHPPGTQYEDVLETMPPYVSFEGDPAAWEPAAELLRRSPWAGSDKGDPQFASLSESVIGHWGELLQWLKAQKA